MTMGTAQRIAIYQDRCHQMVAPAGKRLAGPGTLSKAKKRNKDLRQHCTKPPYREGAKAMGTLGRREKKLWARQQAHAAMLNANKDSTGYRKPGSMTK